MSDLNSKQSAFKSGLDKNWNDIIISIEVNLENILSNEIKLNVINALRDVPDLLYRFIDKVDKIISAILSIREANTKLEKNWIVFWRKYKRDAIYQAARVIPSQFQEAIDELDSDTLDKVVYADVISQLKIIKLKLQCLDIKSLDNLLSISPKREKKKQRLNFSYNPQCAIYNILYYSDSRYILNFLKENYNLGNSKDRSILGMGDILDKIKNKMGFDLVSYIKNIRKLEFYHGDDNKPEIIFCASKSPIINDKIKGSLALDKTKITKTGPAQCQSRLEGVLDYSYKHNHKLRFYSYSRKNNLKQDLDRYISELNLNGFISGDAHTQLKSLLNNDSDDVVSLDSHGDVKVTIDQISEQLAYKKHMLSLVSNMFNKPDNKTWCVIGNGDPGHHSPPACGFCGDNLVHYFASDLDFINHVTVLDVDVNFGNGTWLLAENNQKISFHDVSDPCVWPYIDRSEDKSKELYSYNLEKGMSDNNACGLIDKVFENIYEYLNTKSENINQELFVLSLGYDALNGDPQSKSRTSITVKYYQHIFSKIKELKQDFPEIKMVVLPEGGYWPEKSKLLHRDLIDSLCSVDLNLKLDEQECVLF